MVLGVKSLNLFLSFFLLLFISLFFFLSLFLFTFINYTSFNTLIVLGLKSNLFISFVLLLFISFFFFFLSLFLFTFIFIRFHTLHLFISPLSVIPYSIPSYELRNHVIKFLCFIYEI
jgi:hypothetical protein